MKKFLALFLVLVASLSSLMACGDNGGPNVGPGGGSSEYEEEEVDYSRTQLYISNFNGGYGNEWLYKAKYRFEAKYAETSFEDGKKGVQIYIDDNKDQGHNVFEFIADSRNEIFFTQGTFYYDFVGNDLIADITDIITEDLTAKYGESGTILDKFNDFHKDYFSVDGHYYAIPYCSGYYGIMYDVDLFEKKGFYFAANTAIDANTNKYNTDLNNGNNGFIFDKTDVKSNGPDGKPGTSDDGLPATYEEFFMLCDYILGAGCKPIIWTGEYRNDYVLNFLRSLCLDYEGDEMNLNYTFDGVATHLIDSIDSNGNITFKQPTQITSENGYEYISQTAGKYYAMKFYQQLTSNSAYYFGKCFNETHSHTDAQDDFLFSRPEGNEPIAMLFEGTYWANEAKTTFEDIGALYGEEYDAYHRNIGIMPMPKATKNEIGEPFTVNGDVSSLGFINANCNAEKLALAKLFLQFVNTDVSLREFTVTTNTVKELKYELTSDDLAQMTGFGRLLWNTKQNVNLVYKASRNSIFANNTIILVNKGYETKMGGATYNRPVDELRGTSSSKIDAKDYFMGLRNFYNSTWWNSLNGVN